MSWKPFSETEIWDLLNNEELDLSVTQSNLWEAIKITPEKWQESSFGTQGGGFWVVGIIGKQVLWYNDIEEGFNLSNYRNYGVIEEYWCNQDELKFAVQNLLNLLSDKNNNIVRLGPPEPLS